MMLCSQQYSGLLRIEYAQVFPTGSLSFSEKLNFQMPRILSAILVPILAFNTMKNSSTAIPATNASGSLAYSSIQKFAKSVGMNAPTKRIRSEMGRSDELNSSEAGDR